MRRCRNGKGRKGMFPGRWMLVLAAVAGYSTSAWAAGGDLLWQYGQTAARTQTATDAAVTATGNVAITGYSSDGGDDFYTAVVKADGSGVLWTASFDLAGGADQAAAVAIDDNGDVIVTGHASNGVNFDFHTIKYDGSTGAVLWENTYDGEAGGHDYPTAIAVDGQNNIYVAGKSQGASASDDWLIVKYHADGANPDGTPIWVKTYSGAADGNDGIAGLAAGPDGLAATGYVHNGGDFDYRTMKYGFDGSDAWPAGIVYDSGGVNDHGEYVRVDAAGDVVVTGHVGGGSAADIHTVKYAAADGGLVWSRTYATPAGAYPDEPRGMALGQTGDVYLAGLTYTLTGANDMYFARYAAADGAPVWEQVYNSVNGNVDEPAALVVAGSGDLFVTGHTHKDAAGDDDITTLKYGGDTGTLLWEHSFNHALSQDEKPVGLGLSSSGEVFIGGWSDMTAPLDGGGGTASGGTATTVADTSRTWTADQWAGYAVMMTGGANAGVNREIAGNTADTLTVTVPFATAPANGDTYYIYDPTDYDYYALKYDPGLLNAPTSLDAATASDTAIDLSWTDNAANEDGFRIWRRQGETGGFAEIATVGADVTTYADTGLTSHVWYYYRVQAYNSTQGDSNFSNTDGALTTAISYDPPAWSFLFDGPDSGDDFAYGIAAGPDDNPVVTGTSFALSGGFDYYTAKIDLATATELWNVRYNDVDDQLDVATCVTVDGNNDVIVSGYSSLYGGGAGNTNDVFTQKYPAAGPPEFGDPQLWDDQYNGPAGDDDRSEAVDSASDGSNSTVVVGYGKNASFNDDIYVLKYLADGTRAWAATPYNGAADGHDYPSAVRFDSAGDVLVTGETHNGGDYDIFTRKYSGTDGTPVWTVVHDHGSGDDAGNELAVDSSGNAYVAGYVTTAAGNTDLYLVKYAAADGAELWSRMVDGTANGDDAAAAVSVDPVNGEIIVVGTVLSGGGNNDFFLARYDAVGNSVWERTLQRPANDDYLRGMSMDGSGNVCVAGNTDDGAYTDLLAVKYDHLGNIMGGTLYDGAAGRSEGVEAMTANGAGDQFVAGYSTTAGGDANYLVLICNGEVMQAAPLTATPYYTSVDLAWVDNNGNEDGFSVERKPGGCESADPWQLIHTAAAGATSHTDTALVSDTAYCYRIQAFKNTGQTSRWVEEEVTTLIPQPPSGFSVTPVNTTTVNLAWTDNTTGEEGFKIERCAGAGCGDFTTLAATAADAVAYSDDTVCEGTTYSYRVLAFKSGDWQSGFSAVDADNTTAAKAAPTGFGAARLSEAEIRLTWTDNTADESGFTIERCTGVGCGDFATLTTTAANATSHDDSSGIVAGETYRYRAYAAKTASCGWSTAYTAEAEAEATILAPSGLAAVPVNTTRIDLSWTDNTASETGFAIERCTGAGCSGYVEVATVGANATTYSDTGVCAGTSYNYRVKAFNLGGGWDSGYDTASAATPAVADPTSLNAVRVSEEEIGLSWTDNTADETGFEIERCAGAGCGDFSQIASPGADTAVYADTDLVPGTTYRYQVRAVKSATCGWNSGYTATAEAVTTLAGPSGLAAVAADTTTVDLSWTDNTAHETDFVVERCAGAGCVDFAEIGAAGANAVAYSDITACSNTSYSYRIKAANNGLSSGGGSGACWTRRAPLSVTGFVPNALAEFTVNHAPDMQAGFDDLRFYDATAGRELSYWIESKTDGVSATVWLQTGDNNNIHMYYGNAAALSASNRDALMEFADDFAGTTPDTAKWVEIDPNGQFSWSDGLNINYVDTSWNAAVISQQTFDRRAGKTFYARVNSQEGPTGDYMMMGWELNQTGNASYTQLVHGLYWNNSYFRTYEKAGNYNYQNYTSYSRSNTDYEVKIVLKGGGARYYIRGGAYGSWRLVHDLSNYGDTPLRVAVTQRSHQARIDFLAVLNSDLTEVSVTPGTEETSACFPFANTWESGYSNTATDVTPAPMPPAELAANAISESQLDLGWADNTGDETGFAVERCEGAGCSGFAEVDTIGGANDSIITLLHMDEAAWNGTAGEVTDGSGRGNHGTAAGNATTAPGDHYNGSGVFDGADDYVTLGDVDAMDAPAAFTAMLWFKRAADIAAPTNHGINNVLLAQSANATNDNLEIGTEAGAVEIYVDSENGTSEVMTIEGGIVDDTWYHLALVYDRDAADGNEIKLYLDGSLLGQWSDADGALSSSTTSPLTIGLARPGTDNWGDFQGNIDEVVIYGRALDAAEVYYNHTHPTGFRLRGYSDTGLALATTYNYRVRAYKTAACPWNEYSTNTVEIATLAPPPPGDLAANAADTTTVDLSWTDNTGAETGFSIERCTGAGCVDFVEIATTAADVTAYSDTSAAHSTAYTYQVKAFNDVEVWSSAASNTATDTTPTPPDPAGLGVATVSEVQLDLSWTDNTSDETGFRIERGDAGCGGFVEIATVGADVTAYSDTGLTPGAGYCYQVRAYKTAANSWNTGYSATATGTATITPPSGFSASPANTTRIDLSWTDTTASETGFEIDRCSGGGCGDFVLLATTGAAASAYSDTTVANGTAYNYRVRAVGSGWNSTYTSAGATTPAPTAPSALAAVRISEEGIDLSWTDNTSDETNFRVERGAADCTGFAEIAVVAANTTSYSDSGLNYSTTYCYRVRAFKSADNQWFTDYGNTDTATTSIQAPDGLNATPVNTTQVDLAWNDQTVTETGFEIERCGGAGCGDFALLDTVAADSTTYSDTTVCNSQPYSYRVRAVRSGEWNSGYSNTAADATPPTPVAPADLTVVSTAEDLAELAWTDNTSDETAFEVERCTGADCSGFASLSSEAADSVSYADATVVPSTDYCYRVRAVKSASCGWQTGYTAKACDLTIQAAPTTLSATALNSMMIQLDWSDNASDETGYEVEELVWNGEWVLLETLGADVTGFTATMGIEEEQTHTYRVRAVRGGDYSAYSNEASDTTPGYVTGDESCTP